MPLLIYMVMRQGGQILDCLRPCGQQRSNVVLGVNFNRTTAGDSVIYFDKENLLTTLSEVENLTPDEGQRLHEKAQAIIEEKYTWEHICAQYEDLFAPKFTDDV